MPALIIHGGAGTPRAREQQEAIATALDGIARHAWTLLQAGESALTTAVAAAHMLEDNPLFNAGLGSKLQSDGAARLSAALMDGDTERFSGVINVEGLLNPIDLCLALQTEQDRVLAGTGALERARVLGLAEGDVRTEASIAAWKRRTAGQTGTVGAVVLDTCGRIAAATSTGGRGMEGIGRVSDSATVAGNFASAVAGVSCTGIGEDIVDGALAARLVSAADAGQPLNDAAQALRTKMLSRGWRAGLIALDKHGKWTTIQTTEVMYWHAIDGAGHHQFKVVDPQ